MASERNAPSAWGALKANIRAHNDTTTGFAAVVKQQMRVTRAQAEHARNRARIRSIFRYIVFLTAFMMMLLRDLTDADVFTFADNVKRQFTDPTFLPKHAPTDRKTFGDIGTVSELYQWLEGPFVQAVFSPNTFDGDRLWRFEQLQLRSASHKSNSSTSTMLGAARFVGAVRISQYRTQQQACSSIPPFLSSSSSAWRCYAMPSADGSGESVTSFGQFMDRGPFQYNGMRAAMLLKNNTSSLRETVDQQRARAPSTWYPKRDPLDAAYPAPAFGLTFNPAVGVDRGAQAIQALAQGKYVGPETRAVFIDVALFNPMLNHLVHGRMVVEFMTAMSVRTTASFEAVRLWDTDSSWDRLNFWDRINFAVSWIVLGFYIAYFVEDMLLVFNRGLWNFIGSAANLVSVINFFIFVSWFCVRAYAATLVPEEIEPDGDDFIDFWPSVRLRQASYSLAAITIVLNMARLIDTLSIFHVFKLISTTFAIAARGLVNFVIIFFIVLFGFSQSHALLLSTNLYEFRTIANSVQTLLRSLMGDFDFRALQHTHWLLGPTFFFLFVCISYFVVLNMLIAIVGDSYIECQEIVSNARQVDVKGELVLYFVEMLTKLPFLGKRLRRTVFASVFRKEKSRMRRMSMSVGEPLPPKADSQAQLGISPPKNQDYGDKDDIGQHEHKPARDVALKEWFIALKQSEEDMESARTELSALKREVRKIKAGVQQRTQDVIEKVRRPVTSGR